MSDYRDEMRVVHSEAKWTLWKFSGIILALIVAVGITGFSLHSVGVIGNTVVERVVFTNSYQRSAAMRERLAVDEATLAEINVRLGDPTLSSATKTALKAQASAVRVRITTTKGISQ